MARSTTSISLFSLLLLPLLLLKKVESQNTNFSIDIFTPHSQKLTYEREASVPPDESYVRLTTHSTAVGRVLYRAPVQLWETGKQASFETTITLQITPEFPNGSGGEGMTFFIVPVNSTLSTDGFWGNLGIYDSVSKGSPIFAVEFDVLSQDFDPDYKHIGININSERSQNTTRVEDDILRTRVTARITYDVPTRKINVVATYGSTTATVSFFFNLAALLPQQVQVGLSASAGGNFVAYFDAYTWHFNSTMGADVNSVTRKDTSYIEPYVM